MMKTPSGRREMGTLLALVNVVLVFLMSANPVVAKPEAPIRIVAFGDSLTAGFMLAPSESFPAQLKRALDAKGYDVEVVNAGVSGDTTGAALARFDWAFGEGADAAIVELGANDGLRGQPPAQARQNLDKILKRLKEKGTSVLLAGMTAPRNWGPDYVREFEAMFPDLAREHDAILYPFFLEGVALDASLNMPDGLHPTAKGIGVIVERILPRVEALIARVKAKRAAAKS